MKLSIRDVRNGLVVVTTFFARTASIRADTTPDVIEKVRTAIGIDAFEREDKAVRLTGPLEFIGLKGRHTFIFDAAGRFRSTYDCRLSIDTLYDGHVVRSRDMGGEVTNQAFGDRSASLFAGWAVSGFWFSRERSKGFRIDEGAGSENVVVLATDLDDGKATARVTIDRATWRPVKWAFDGAIGNSEIELEGASRVGPLVLPARVKISSNHGSLTVYENAKFEVAPIPNWSVESAAMKSPDDASFGKGASPKLEIRKADTGHLLVHPLVAGKDAGWFIFDTGAGQNCLDRRAVQEAGIETFGSVPAVGVGGATQASLCRPSTLTLGPLTLHEPLAVVMDFAFLDAHMGVKVAGIIGYGTLARCVVEFDLAEESISLYDAATYQLTGAEWTSLIVYDRVPCVPARFEGHEGTFRLDTGASGWPIAFHSPTVERLNLLEGRKNKPTSLGGVGGRKAARRGKVQWLEFGGKRHKKVDAAFAIEDSGAFADPYIDANVGVALIGKSTMILDYPHTRIAFKWKPDEAKMVNTASHPAASHDAVTANSANSHRPGHRASGKSTPMAMVNDRPVIELTMQGQGPYRFVFDTGAGITVLTPELARELKLEATGKTQIGDPAAPNAVEVDTVAVDFEVCDERFKNVPAVVWDDKAIFSALGDVRGIVGTSALGDRVVTLDFSEKQFRLTKKPLSESDGTVHCDNHHGIPMMDLSIAGQTVPVHLDTGSTRDLSVPAKLRDKLVFKNPPVSAQGRTANGEYDIEIATLDGDVEIAGRKIADPELEITDRFQQAVVGTGVLRRFVIDIDLSNELARFTPIKGWKPPASEKRRYGIMMSMGDGPVTVAGVRPGSIADRAGLRKDDRILKANGQDFESLNFTERGKITRQSPLALTIERNGKQLEIRLAFEDPSNPGDEHPVKTNSIE